MHSIIQPLNRIRFVHRIGASLRADPRRASELAPIAVIFSSVRNFLGDRDDVLASTKLISISRLGELAGGRRGSLVAVAAGDLVVAFHPRHHQQLLEQLRALR